MDGTTSRTSVPFATACLWARTSMLIPDESQNLVAVRTVIADMTGTRFCDSSGISMLVLAHRKAMTNNAELRLVALSTAVLRALTLVRIDYLLPVYPSLADALLPEPPPGTATAR